ncbi:MAG: sialidase family protein, partial [Ktedonobacterales bacterium]
MHSLTRTLVATRAGWRRRNGAGISAIVILALILALLLMHLLATRAQASASLTQLSSDPYTNTTSQHATQVEPDTFAAGATMVSAFQSGRFYDGGASNIGWATSNDSGVTWAHGFLPGITVYDGGLWDRVSDPAVAYDLGHHTWLISSLVISGTTGAGVVVSRSTDGGKTWSNPVNVALAPQGAFYDKEWVVCDSQDPMFSPPITLAQRAWAGYCYVEWDDANAGIIHMSVSHDGGKTWSAPNSPQTSDFGLGGQPLIQPDGTVIVPMWLTTPSNQNYIGAYRSTDQGKTWSAPVRISSLTYANDPGNIRGGSLPSAEIDGSGRVYVVWADCRIEPGCSANDIVISSSSDGVSWSSVTRIPMDAVGSGADHLLAGIAVNTQTSGASAQLGVVY